MLKSKSSRPGRQDDKPGAMERPDGALLDAHDGRSRPLASLALARFSPPGHTPPAMPGEDSTSSPDEIAVLQAYIDLINSEREAIWARHNALLVANSLIIGALAISPAALWQNKWAALGMISAGAIISAAWLGITLEGWSAMKRHADLARKFASTYFKHLPNALDETLSDHAQTNIHHLILLVIGVFVLMYVGLGYIRLVSA